MKAFVQALTFMLLVIWCCRSACAAPVNANPRIVTPVEQIYFSKEDCDKLLKDAFSSRQGYERLAGLVEKHPRSWQAHILLGIYYAKTGFKVLAGQELETAETLAEGNPDSLFAVLGARMATFQMEEAARLVERGYARFPRDKRFSFLHIVFLEVGKQHDQADVARKQAEMAAPGRPEFVLLGGIFAMKQGDWNKALVQADKALAVNSKYPLAHMLKVNALVKLNRQNEALKHLAHSFEKEPLNVAVNDIYLDQLMTRNQFSEALEPALCSFAAASAMDATAGRDQQLASLLAVNSRRRIRQAISKTDERLQDFSQRARYCLALADLLEKITYFDLAAEQYKQAVGLLPESAALNERVGDYMENTMRSHDQALSYYLAARKLGSSSKSLDGKIASLKAACGDYWLSLGQRVQDALYLSWNNWMGNIPAANNSAQAMNKVVAQAVPVQGQGVGKTQSPPYAVGLPVAGSNCACTKHTGTNGQPAVKSN